MQLSKQQKDRLLELVQRISCKVAPTYGVGDKRIVGAVWAKVYERCIALDHFEEGFDNFVSTTAWFEARIACQIEKAPLVTRNRRGTPNIRKCLAFDDERTTCNSLLDHDDPVQNLIRYENAEVVGAAIKDLPHDYGEVLTAWWESDGYDKVLFKLAARKGWSRSKVYRELQQARLCFNGN